MHLGVPWGFPYSPFPPPTPSPLSFLMKLNYPLIALWGGCVKFVAPARTAFSLIPVILKLFTSSPPKHPASSLSSKDIPAERSRTPISLQTKLEIHECLERNESVVFIGQVYGVNESTIHTIKRNGDKIKKSVAKAPSLSSSVF